MLKRWTRIDEPTTARATLSAPACLLMVDSSRYSVVLADSRARVW